MSYVIKYRWALIGTFFLHLGMVLYFRSVPLKRHYVPVGELEQIPIVLEDPEEKEKMAELDPNLQPPDGKISNLTVNERDKVGESDKKYDARSYKNIDSDAEQDVRDYEKSVFEEFANERKKNQKDVPVETKKEKINNTNTDSNTDKVRSAGRVSGSYDLDGRVHENFVKPAYVCKGSGTIVMNVKLNRNGKVTSAQIDPAKSNYTEECMGENAIKYAYKCKFEAGTQWGDPQAGTITYTYISQ